MPEGWSPGVGSDGTPVQHQLVYFLERVTWACCCYTRALQLGLGNGPPTCLQCPVCVQLGDTLGPLLRAAALEGKAQELRLVDGRHSGGPSRPTPILAVELFRAPSDGEAAFRVSGVSCSRRCTCGGAWWGWTWGEPAW